ncbi:peptidyl-prolyl cis-trans isomerase-like 3 isoform X2 [Anolis carolinensis]|uniref:peptidyl-prolyl cis-trans isomerase-like 3 isoform X2 n=1 Tax=Anolis carolinensis TaxID=28377 RepID=UPI000462BCD2|nr:PREDICTED: peptidyl-prolyl cis-trans isomerase-like 3 isoform X2 [Anolis carolinensis]|eukprot:XP_008112049.1 PREDICTED: peptidyl-prolyl cis-trans isomerase-like 3 isoform X2 [Anolis carolinensis]
MGKLPAGARFAAECKAERGRGLALGAGAGPHQEVGEGGGEQARGRGPFGGKEKLFRWLCSEFLVCTDGEAGCFNIFFLTACKAVTLHTDVGDIKIELFCERTPKACENFLALCASNYYNGCIFHRNIKGFMVQTGDPMGSGKGGNSIWGRKFEDEYSEYLKHSVRGVVSMANNGPNTNGSQFFITYGKQPHLDMKYTVFGKVIDGLDTLDELEKLPVNEKTFRPLNDVHIKDVTMHANPFAQ